MLNISTVPPLPLFHADESATVARRHPDVEDEMDFEDEYDVGEGSSGDNKYLTSPGETITSSKEFMRGHGTYVEDEDVVASVTGLIERVNKLVSVRPLKSR
jgi:exosome complex component RRP4